MHTLQRTKQHTTTKECSRPHCWLRATRGGVWAAADHQSVPHTTKPHICLNLTISKHVGFSRGHVESPHQMPGLLHENKIPDLFDRIKTEDQCPLTSTHVHTALMSRRGPKVCSMLLGAHFMLKKPHGRLKMPLSSLFIIIKNISEIRAKHVGGLNYHHLETWHWHGKYGSRLNITKELSHILCTFVVLLYCNLYGFIVMRWLTMVITIKSTGCLQNPFPSTCNQVEQVFSWSPGGAGYS